VARIPRAAAPDRFISLYAEGIELHSILEAPLCSAIARPVRGQGERRSPISASDRRAVGDDRARLDDVVARGDKVVCVGHATWRNLKTLRVVSGPKVDVWTVRDGLAVHYLEMFDSYGCAARSA
jgi:ketosteroid isomerase-like protein